MIEQERVILDGFSPRHSLQSTYFYTIDSRGEIPEVSLEDKGFNIVKNLVYKEKGTALHKGHMFLCERADGKRVKVRICFNAADATRIEQNVHQAVSIGIATPRILDKKGEVLILEYIEGENINDLSIEQMQLLGEIHARLQTAFPSLAKDTQSALQQTLEVAFAKLAKLYEPGRLNELINSTARLFPEEIIPVFDHQDVGPHNTLKGDDGQLWLIDEEAFGIVPFGYTLERALHGLGEYSTCKTDDERIAYLQNFSEDRVAYYQATREFWKIILSVRTAGRAVVHGKPEKAIEIMKPFI